MIQVFVLLLLGLGAVSSLRAETAEAALEKKVPEIFADAQAQYRGMLKQMESHPALLPRCVDKGVFRAVDAEDWTSGFFPGALWYLYEYAKTEEWKSAAKAYTERLEKIRHYTGNHDVGFMLYCSYGNGLRLTQEADYKNVLLDGAKALMTRYNPRIGLIRSWNDYTFPVIIDNMMNLELLMWASRKGGGEQCEEVACHHADTTLRKHFRPDGSAYHVIDYNPMTGAVLGYHAGQGAAVNGTWARGQSWGLYGFTMMYRETKEKKYLERAVKSADYLLGHKNLPQDGVPYWDFEAADIPSAWRDASSAAIMASALLELSSYVQDEKAKAYRSMAVRQLTTLSSPAYRASPGSNGCFLLMHSVGNLPKDYEIDAPINYTDYYYLEALLRFLQKK